ncbi:hypothetical protein CDAR_207691 [Caerostris darwini]|uniref:Uncharacterized protein n=1 Tax=Caerostris darwini TaxID=1538125 RepID=A0AAV4WUC1_9ARAC|nr:hypothetical protein CDAR_207691 [Caerostris darwini]
MDDTKKSYLKAAFNSRFCFHQTFFNEADVLLLTHSFFSRPVGNSRKRQRGFLPEGGKPLVDAEYTTPSDRRWLCAGKQRPKQSAKGGDKGALLGERDARDCLYLFFPEVGEIKAGRRRRNSIVVWDGAEIVRYPLRFLGSSKK